MTVIKTPRNVDVEITSACNLRCTYCSHFSSASDVPADLPLETWLAFFEVLGRAAVLSVTLSGGEPFLRPDLKELLQGIVRNRMRFSFLSNGTLITEDMARFIAATGRCNSIQVSLDGAEPLSHDAFRGAGAFTQAVRGIRILQAANLPVTVRVTIHRENVRDLDAIAHYLLEEIGLPSFSTNAASHMGLCRKNAEMTQLTTAEKSLAMETLLRLTRQYEGRITATAGPLADARLWGDMENACRSHASPHPDRGALTGCTGPYATLAIRADGVMIPCLQLGHLALGHILEDDLTTVWQTSPILKGIRERHHIPLASLAFCADCPYIPYCTGNCPATAYTLSGDVNAPAPDACYRRFLIDGGRLPEGLDFPA